MSEEADRPSEAAGVGAEVSLVDARYSQGAPYPEYLKDEQAPYNPRVMRVPVGRFFEQAYHDLEVEKLWKKCWQFVCREEHIPNVGDYIVYDIAELSFIVTRTAPDEIKAYWNSCLHRGRRLCEHDGKRAKEFRCMFHGWAWNVDGTMSDMTCGWDFPGAREEVTRLPEAKVGTWGGFVFINPDLDAEPLADFLKGLPENFEQAGNDLSDRWTQVHVMAELRVNWKVAQEAFFEAWHAGTTHPHMVRTAVDQFNAGNRWDNFDNWMRFAPGLPTDKNKAPPGGCLTAEEPQQVLDYYFNTHLNEDPVLRVVEGKSPDELINAGVREHFRGVMGEEVDCYHAVVMRGGDMLSVFPNFHPWGGLARIVYRFRPYRSDPERCLAEVMLLSPLGGRPRPPPSPMHYIGPDEPMTNAAELGYLARVFVQDIMNMEAIQRGMKSSKRGFVMLSVHNDAPVRKFHDLYNRWLGLEDEQPKPA